MTNAQQSQRSSTASVGMCWLTLPFLLLLGVGVTLGAAAEAAHPGRPQARSVTLYTTAPEGTGCPGASPFLAEIERVRMLLQRAELDVTIICTSWSRAVMLAQSDPNGLIAHLSRTTEREPNFFWLLETSLKEYGLATMGARFDSPKAALDEGMVVTLRGTTCAEDLLRIGPRERVILVNDAEQAARLLDTGRVVAWYGPADALQRARPPVYAAMKTIGKYLAASSSFTDAEAVSQHLRTVHRAMLADGSWEQIGQRFAPRRL